MRGSASRPRGCLSVSLTGCDTVSESPCEDNVGRECMGEDDGGVPERRGGVEVIDSLGKRISLCVARRTD